MTTIISSFILIITYFYPTLYSIIISAFLFAAFEVLCYSSLLAMSSNAVSVNLQGKVMGGLGAVTSIALIITGILLPFLSDINVLVPILGAGTAYILSTVIMLRIKS